MVISVLLPSVCLFTSIVPYLLITSIIVKFNWLIHRFIYKKKQKSNWVSIISKMNFNNIGTTKNQNYVTRKTFSIITYLILKSRLDTLIRFLCSIHSCPNLCVTLGSDYFITITVIDTYRKSLIGVNYHNIRRYCSNMTSRVYPCVNRHFIDHRLVLYHYPKESE